MQRSSSASIGFTPQRASGLPTRRSGSPRRRTIADGMERLRRADPERYEQILMRLRRYDQRLRRFGLRDRHLDWQISRRDVGTFAVREIALGIVLLPLCALGLLVFFVPYQLTGFVARRVARQARRARHGAGVLPVAAIYGAWLAAIGAVIWWMAGRTVAMWRCALRAARCGGRALCHRTRVGRDRCGARVVAAPPRAPRHPRQAPAAAVRARRPAGRGQPVALADAERQACWRQRPERR